METANGHPSLSDQFLDRMTASDERRSSERSGTLHRPDEMTAVGSTVVTNAPFHKPPSVIGCDFRCPKLRSVETTAAPNDNSVLRAVDATACRKKTAKLASAWITSSIRHSSSGARVGYAPLVTPCYGRESARSMWHGDRITSSARHRCRPGTSGRVEHMVR